MYFFRKVSPWSQVSKDTNKDKKEVEFTDKKRTPSVSINEETKVKVIGSRRKKRKGSQQLVKVDTSEEIISTLDLYPQLGKISIDYILG